VGEERKEDRIRGIEKERRAVEAIEKEREI
jgi:hypothetical protein